MHTNNKGRDFVYFFFLRSILRTIATQVLQGHPYTRDTDTLNPLFRVHSTEIKVRKTEQKRINTQHISGLNKL